MGRILAIDYGMKRVGIAVTDPLRLIATPLRSIEQKKLITFLTDYIKTETVEIFVIGAPKRLNNTNTHLTVEVENFIKVLNIKFPNILVETIDERFTSKIASQEILASGIGKKDRMNKERVDLVSATLILQSYLIRMKI
ncbi:MAG: Holliday junction DNA helicase RuvA [Bacteroidetes bacterium GWE2_29_8]|nr:MAG: Holliday junction DNA helicase RuvA [Bacteroidetes bacterium GWE2_29_8]OFY15755.1 MAG: Holliday junction DNA helicase RuvA [Bacteroidetes bacterium GWF2_29_10]